MSWSLISNSKCRRLLCNDSEQLLEQCVLAGMGRCREEGETDWQDVRLQQENRSWPREKQTKLESDLWTAVSETDTGLCYDDAVMWSAVSDVLSELFLLMIFKVIFAVMLCPWWAQKKPVKQKLVAVISGVTCCVLEVWQLSAFHSWLLFCFI